MKRGKFIPTGLALAILALLLQAGLVSGCRRASAPDTPVKHAVGQVVEAQDEYGIFYAYIPQSAPSKPEILVLVHGTPAAEETPEQTAHYYISNWTAFAEEQGWVLLAPAFSQEDFSSRKGDHALGGYRGLFGRRMDAGEWVLRLVAAHQRAWGEPDRPFFLYGHSAGGQFTAHFLVTYPERIQRAVISAAATYPQPDADVAWPFGMGELHQDIAWDEQTSRKVDVIPDKEKWLAATQVPLTVVVGLNDTSELPPYPGQKGKNRFTIGRNWVNAMGEFAQQNGLESRIRFEMIPGKGHSMTGLIPYSQKALAPPPPASTPAPAINQALPPTATLAPASTSEPQRALQPITLANAGQVQWLQTLDIPDYRKGQISQCSVTFSPDGSLLVGACGNNRVPVWQMPDGALRQQLYEKPQQIVACAFSPDGDSIACGGFDKTITLWSSKTGQKTGDFGAHESPVWDIDYSPDGQKLASCGLADDVCLWDAPRGEMIWRYTGRNAYLSVAFDPSGANVAFGGRWGDAGVLEVATGKSLADVMEQDKPIGDVAFSPSGKLLAAGTDDHSIYLWEAGNYQPVATLEGHAHYVNGVSFSPDESLLASGSHDKTLGIWDVAGQRLLKTLDGHQDAILRVAFSPDGTLIATISWDGTVRLWGVKGKS